MVITGMALVYKICTVAEWNGAAASGKFSGSAADLADGFIHLSAAHQLRGTAAKHFKGREDLVLVAFDADALPGLQWEPSRGGDLFPHVHGSLAAARATWVKPLPLIDGVHVFPDETVS